MKRIILLIVVGGFSGLFCLRKQLEKSAAEAAAKENPPRQVYEHDWAKQALDETSKGVRDRQEGDKRRTVALSAALVIPLCKLRPSCMLHSGAPARPSCETLNADARLLAPDEASSGSQF